MAVSPYDEGWLLEVRCPKGLRQLDGLMDSEEVRDRAGEQRRELQKRATSYLDRSRARVGATMPDGGRPLTGLRRILGPERYRRLIVKILG